MCIRDSCKPVPVPLRAAVIHLDRPLLTGSSDLPGSSAGRAVPSSPIWSCSAWGFPCRQNYSCRGALLPHHFTLTPPCGEAVYFLWHFPSSPCEPARPLAGTLPCGDRTFLSRRPEGTRERLPVRQPHSIILTFLCALVYWKHQLPCTKIQDFVLDGNIPVYSIFSGDSGRNLLTAASVGILRLPKSGNVSVQYV